MDVVDTIKQITMTFKTLTTLSLLLTTVITIQINNQLKSHLKKLSSIAKEKKYRIIQLEKYIYENKFLKFWSFSSLKKAEAELNIVNIVKPNAEATISDIYFQEDEQSLILNEIILKEEEFFKHFDNNVELDINDFKKEFSDSDNALKKELVDLFIKNDPKNNLKLFVWFFLIKEYTNQKIGLINLSWHQNEETKTNVQKCFLKLFGAIEIPSRIILYRNTELMFLAFVFYRLDLKFELLFCGISLYDLNDRKMLCESLRNLCWRHKRDHLLFSFIKSETTEDEMNKYFCFVKDYTLAKIRRMCGFEELTQMGKIENGFDEAIDYYFHHDEYEV